MSTEKEQESRTCEYWSTKFKEAMVHKAKETSEWYDYWDAYTGEYFNKDSRPKYKSNQVSNFIFSTIESIRPIMVDNNPRFLALARSEEGMKKNDKVQMALDYEFDRECMDEKIPRQAITSLVLGTSVWFLPWDGEKGELDGEVSAIEVNPFNLFPDPLATCVEDAEYLIYATYKHVNKLKKLFPKKSNLLEGGNIKYRELVANRGSNVGNTDNQVLVLEIWCRDYATTEFEEKDDDGNKYKVIKRKYPKGRVLTIAPELSVVLDDKKNPYKSGEFPFVLIKDYDVPFKFWGEGEPKQLLSPQKYINELSNQIIDNAKLTANQVWVIDKNSGIGYGKLTNRPGLVIRKNPGSEVRRDTPPPMPMYVSDKVHDLKSDIEVISGIHDVTRGERPTGIQAGNAIMALQEAGQARVRLKVKLMEQGLSKLATMWYNRMQQFWSLDRWVRVFDDKGEHRLEKITKDDLTYDFDIKITSGSTMPNNRSAMLDMLIRLAQTTGEDGLPMIDRESLLEFVDIKDKSRVIKKFDSLREEKNLTEEVMQQTEQANQEVMQEVQGLQEEVKEGFDQMISVIDEITGVIEGMQKDINKLYQYHEDDKKSEEEEKIREEGRQEVLSSMPYEEESEEIPLEEEEEYLEEPMDEEELQDIEDESEEPIVDIDLPDEIIEMIANLSDEELQELLRLKPEMQEIIANNLGGELA